MLVSDSQISCGSWLMSLWWAYLSLILLTIVDHRFVDRVRCLVWKDAGRKAAHKLCYFENTAAFLEEGRGGG
jgi:hypothetical protein